MKKLLSSTILLSFLLFVGCEKSGMKEKDDYFAQQEEFLQEISVGLSMSDSQENDARGHLHNSKSVHPHPASLWKLAKHLYNNLSEEQLAILESWKSDGEFGDHAFNNGGDDHRPPHFDKMLDEKHKYLSEIFDETQMTAYEEVANNYRNMQIELNVKWENQEISLDEFKAEIFAAHNYFKIGFHSILTEEQILEFEMKHVEYADKKRHHHGKYAMVKEHIQQMMFDALEMTDDQITSLETLMTNFKEGVELNNQQFLDKLIDAETLFNNISSLFLTTHTSKHELFTEEQQKIILIHHILSMKAKRKFAFWRK